MCSVRQSAVDRVYGLSKKFKELKKKNENLKTLLTGCISNSDLKKFKNFFDFILSIKSLDSWPKILNPEGEQAPYGAREKKYFYYPNPRTLFGAKYLNEKAKYSKNFSAYVPISIGCDNFCSFCIVPYVRGPLICRPFEDILEEVKSAIEKGAKEIWLLGQNVNDYKFKMQNAKCKMTNQNSKFVNFAKLLKMVNDIEENFWIRFTSPHPKNFSDELIETMAKCQKVTPYLNLPVQSGDDEILKRMNRPYTVKKYKDLIEKITTAFKKYRDGLEKEIALSTDVIVGFPGETKKQFQNTVKLFKEIKFDMAYIAKYSPRVGTTASKLKDNVSPKEKERRYKILTQTLKEAALEKNKKSVGKEIEVLPEEEKNGFLIGKTRHYKTVKFKGDKDFIGKLLKLKIVNAHPFGLEGKLINENKKSLL